MISAQDDSVDTNPRLAVEGEKEMDRNTPCNRCDSGPLWVSWPEAPEGEASWLCTKCTAYNGAATEAEYAEDARAALAEGAKKRAQENTCTCPAPNPVAACYDGFYHWGILAEGEFPCHDGGATTICDNCRKVIETRD